MSDPEGILASPLTVIIRQHDNSDIKAINRIIRENEVAQVIIGLPLKLSGEEGEQAAKVREFAVHFKETSPAPLIFYDERLSTSEANRLRREAFSGKRARRASREPDDDLAAALILQWYLDESRP